jgi:hypothetical protein
MSDYPNIDALLDALPDTLVAATPEGLRLIAERACAARHEIEALSEVDRMHSNCLIEIANRIQENLAFTEEKANWLKRGRPDDD